MYNKLKEPHDLASKSQPLPSKLPLEVSTWVILSVNDKLYNKPMQFSNNNK